MTRDEKQEYRRKRSSIGWLLAAGWVIFWFAQPSDGSFSGNAGHVGMILFALVTWPFAFLVSHYIARFVVENATRQLDAAAEAKRRADQLAAELQHRERMRAIDSDADLARLANNRSELVRKLGSVRDYLALLPNTSDTDRRLMIEQSIAKELRDLIAKHEAPILHRLLSGDEAARLSLTTLLPALETHCGVSAESQFLRNAL